MLNTYDRDGVTVVELDRGPVNALDLELLGALTAAFDRADSPVVLTGAGRTFSAGVDLRRIVEEPDSYVAEFLAALARAFLAVFTHPRPTVAAINGHAIAGGCLFALCCDTRVIGAGTIGLTELAVAVRFPRSGLEIVTAPSPLPPPAAPPESRGSGGPGRRGPGGSGGLDAKLADGERLRAGSRANLEPVLNLVQA